MKSRLSVGSGLSIILFNGPRTWQKRRIDVRKNMQNSFGKPKRSMVGRGHPMVMLGSLVLKGQRIHDETASKAIESYHRLMWEKLLANESALQGQVLPVASPTRRKQVLHTVHTSQVLWVKLPGCTAMARLMQMMMMMIMVMTKTIETCPQPRMLLTSQLKRQNCNLT